MVACPFPRVTPVILGAPDVVAGVTALLVVELALSPIALVAITVKVYSTPLVRPVMTIGEPELVPLKPPIFEVTV